MLGVERPHRQDVTCFGVPLALRLDPDLSPRMLTRDAKHHGDVVITERDDGLLMLAARAGNVHVAVDDGFFVRCQPGFRSSQVGIRRMADGSR